MERIRSEEKDRHTNSSSGDTSDSEDDSPDHRQPTDRPYFKTENSDPPHDQSVHTPRPQTHSTHQDDLFRSQYPVPLFIGSDQGIGHPQQLYNYRANQQNNPAVTGQHRPTFHYLENVQNPEFVENYQNFWRLRNHSTTSNNVGYDSPFYSNGNSLDSHYQRNENQPRLPHTDEIARQTPLENVNRNGQEVPFVRGICFDMRKVNKIDYGEVRRFPSTASALTKETVSNVLQLPESDLKIVENTEVSIGDSARYIVIIASNAMTSAEFILVESLIYVDKEYPELLCVRIPPTGQTVTQISHYIAREMSVKMVAISENCQLLADETLIKNEDNSCRRFEAVRNIKLSVKLVHRPSQKVESRFEIEADTGSNIGQLREVCLQTIGEHITSREDHILHFTFNGRILRDTHCIGTLSWRKREIKLEILIASRNAIGSTLHFKEPTGKGSFTLKKRTLAIEPFLSTAYLRLEISKQMDINPKAVKVTLNGRRIEELESLEELGDDLLNGCVLVAGIKKKKTIRVKDSTTKREESFSLYMLESVQVLKDMIANVFDKKPLQISLKYKVRPMNGNELLVNYPIKNRTEVTMEVFNNRINIRVYIAFKKMRTVLTIDNVTRSTVDDLIRFCALTFHFDRRCARVRYCDQCLTRFSTLAAEKIENNDALVIVYFDQPIKLEGGLITVYTVRPDGQINPRVGAVSGGILLHASKKVKPGTSRNQVNIEDQIPGGIFVCEDRQDPEQKVVPKIRTDTKEDRERKYLTESERRALRKRFVKKARIAKRNVERTHQLTFVDRSGQIRYTESPYQQSSQDSSASETELKTLPCPVDKTRSSPEDDGTSLDTTVKHKTLSQYPFCSIPHDKPDSILTFADNNYTPNKEEIKVNPVSLIAEEQSKDRGTPAFGDTSGSASDVIQTGGRQVEFFLDSESSGHDYGSPWVRTNEVLKAGQPQMGYDYIPRRIARRRTRTEGDIVQFSHHEIHRILTFPTPFQTDDGNRWLNTSGITIDVMNKVSRKIGREWKRLARKLSVPEEDIENIEDGKGDLHYKAFDVLLHWKKSKGSQASKQALLGALREIHMNAVAEYVEEICENLYQTV